MFGLINYVTEGQKVWYQILDPTKKKLIIHHCIDCFYYSLGCEIGKLNYIFAKSLLIFFKKANFCILSFPALPCLLEVGFVDIFALKYLPIQLYTLAQKYEGTKIV